MTETNTEFPAEVSNRYTTVSDNPTTRKETLYRFYGRVSVSPFRTAKLLVSLQEIAPIIQKVSSQFVYFVQSERPLGDDETEQLETFLNSAVRMPKGDLIFMVIPRLGTISPWSSKATDILHNCGLNRILRIEQGSIWHLNLHSGKTLATDTLERIKPLLHDRMTEAVVRPDEAAVLFHSAIAQPLAKVVLSGQGRVALKKANTKMGLALDEAEMDYLYDQFAIIGRNPSDVELMMFSQVNSEHCRHKTFNAKWTINGKQQTESLFDLVRTTYTHHPGRVRLAYCDNAAVINVYSAGYFYPDPNNRRYQTNRETRYLSLKVETHNHPTAISPFAGAATGAGGEIRDEAGTGRGGKPKAGLTGFAVSNLSIPGFRQPWEMAQKKGDKPVHIAPALDIMLEAPIGAAAFNNEFGRPVLCGYFRTYEQADEEGSVWGYHKPIMLAGGYGTILGKHIYKDKIRPGAKIIILGGPAMHIGIGGGTASSMAAGTLTETLDFASVQRSNPEMERRCQEVINACFALYDRNPIISIHDVGAGGLANAIPELLYESKCGAVLELRAIPSADPGMSPLALWCNEAQERYVLAVTPEALEIFGAFCKRERAPFAVLGETNATGRLIVNDSLFDNKAVDLPLCVLLEKLPSHRQVVQWDKQTSVDCNLGDIALSETVHRVLRLPAISDKRFLITISDRSVSGLVVRDQMVGPWQTPVADCAVTASNYDAYVGEAMAVGERAPVAVIDAPASGRMAVGEAITNITAARIMQLEDIALAANWMVACGQANEDAKLYLTVQTVTELCRQLCICIPVGKDSLSMQSTWMDGRQNRQVLAPLSLVVTAFAPVADIRQSLTPQLKTNLGNTRLLLIDLGLGKNRLGGSCLSQVYQRPGGAVPDLDSPDALKLFFRKIQLLNEMGLLLAYHDRSDGGLFTTLMEMAFAGRTGIEVALDYAEDPIAALFCEELGAVIQVREADLESVLKVFNESEILRDNIHDLGNLRQDRQLCITQQKQCLFAETIMPLHRVWSETSFRLQCLRDNPECARQEYDRLLDEHDPGLSVSVTYRPEAAPFIGTGAQPQLAILREQGVNGQIEMAAAFHRAGFTAVDVHMSDILSGQVGLKAFKGLIACGGFSYGDVLGAGCGWANTILLNPQARDEFQSFFAESDTFGLGVCNGCQMFSHLREIIPGAEFWPLFKRNRSEQFEARLVMVEVLDSPSILLADMAGSRIPIAVAHSEGQVVYRDDQAAKAITVLRYIDHKGQPAETYPYNPNGSPQGATAFTTTDGRFTIMMPHPERGFLTRQYSWLSDAWQMDDGPWMRLFYNARQWLS